MIFGRADREDDTVVAMLASALRRDISFGALLPDQKLKIVDTELFGPVLSVLRFRDEAEAVRLANDTGHGLAAGIFTQIGRAHV